jgi:membrane associated rhomboid family serine protease
VEWGALRTSDVLHGQVWRLVTYAFLHDAKDLLHVVLNMFVLWMFGRPLESRYGRREFLLQYLAAAFFAGLFHLGLSLALRTDASVVGASGAVMAVFTLFALQDLRRPIHLWGLFAIEIRWALAAYAALDLLPVVRQFSGAGRQDHVAHVVHLGGMVFAFLYFKRGWRLEHGWSRLTSRLATRSGPFANSSRGSRPDLRVYEPTKEELDARVDALLDKIRDHGEASLTAQEREFLRLAGERYKQKQ